jgi:hypothetical protein
VLRCLTFGCTAFLLELLSIAPAGCEALNRMIAHCDRNIADRGSCVCRACRKRILGCRLPEERDGPSATEVLKDEKSEATMEVRHSERGLGSEDAARVKHFETPSIDIY